MLSFISLPFCCTFTAGLNKTFFLILFAKKENKRIKVSCFFLGCLFSFPDRKQFFKGNTCSSSNLIKNFQGTKPFWLFLIYRKWISVYLYSVGYKRMLHLESSGCVRKLSRKLIKIEREKCLT